MSNGEIRAGAAIGRGLLTLNAIGLAVGGFVADWNRTHLFNPRWPPHARFHDAQTIAFGILLSLTSLLFAWRRAGGPRTNLLAATLVGGLLYWAQAAAFLFPGVAWTDPEFLKPGQSLNQTGPQLYIDGAMTVVLMVAARLAWPQPRPEADT